MEASEDTTTKFKSQSLHVKKSNIEKLVGVATLTMISALWNIGILLHKQATLGKHFEPEHIEAKAFVKRYLTSKSFSKLSLESSFGLYYTLAKFLRFQTSC